MIKIIAGTHRGRQIEVPQTARPTLRRIRQVIFDILAHSNFRGYENGIFDNTLVLDVFSGSGALGLESISRGARHATFVEIDQQAAETISKNVKSLGLESKTKVVCKDFFSLYCATVPVDIIFMDPPYGKVSFFEILQYLDDRGWLSEESIVVLETKNDHSDPFPDIWNVLRYKKIGPANVFILQKKGCSA